MMHTHVHSEIYFIYLQPNTHIYNNMAKNATTTAITHRDIVDAINRREFAPIYLLTGDESYYIDRIADYIADHVLTEEERDFNQQILYCTRETNVADIVNYARRYPMMAEKQVLIVKEAQNLLKFEELSVYAEKPVQTTILVICYKNGSVDRRKKVVGFIEKNGIVYESKKLKENMLPAFITNYLKRKNVKIDDRAVMMMVEYIGSDLNRMAGELDKIVLALPPGFNLVNVDLVEKNIGISKEYNSWELRAALCNKDVLKANRIINYFDQNQKQNPHVVTVSMLFNFFATLMQAYYSPDKTEKGMMEYLEMRNQWQLRDYIQGMRNYTARKTMEIISKIRETDSKLKGIEKGSLSDGDIMRELIYFILH